MKTKLEKVPFKEFYIDPIVLAFDKALYRLFGIWWCRHCKRFHSKRTHAYRATLQSTGPIHVYHKPHNPVPLRGHRTCVAYAVCSRGRLDLNRKRLAWLEQSKSREVSNNG